MNLSIPTIHDIIAIPGVSILLSSEFVNGIRNSPPQHLDYVAQFTDLTGLNNHAKIDSTSSNVILPPQYFNSGGLNDKPYLKIDPNNDRALYISDYVKNDWHTNAYGNGSWTVGILVSEVVVQAGYASTIVRDAGVNPTTCIAYSNYQLGRVSSSSYDENGIMLNVQAARGVLGLITSVNYSGITLSKTVFGGTMRTSTLNVTGTTQYQHGNYNQSFPWCFGFWARASQNDYFTPPNMTTQKCGYKLHEFIFAQRALSEGELDKVISRWKYRYKL